VISAESGTLLIEDKASGTQLIQDLIEEGCHGVTRYQPSGDKTGLRHRRAEAQRDRCALTEA
jgi:phage terminase large subunit-like protein